ncbi:AAA family ATPase [Methanococcoides sp. NM1]|uniref:AAA family ATPase n=1 Tax=Methanococcoides sp. NM1 TaxID=1201013 RepID=UPI001082F1D3|nr:AAA family ATPase [Methanococcoides sp. NM1]
MKIKSISIQNYKCHQNIPNIEFHQITTFIGENDSGKTSIIDFLELILDNKLPEESVFFHNAEGNCASEIIGIITFIPNPEVLDQISHLLNEENELMIKKTLTQSAIEIAVKKKVYEDDRLNTYETLSASELATLLEDLNIEAQTRKEARIEKIKELLNNDHLPHSFDFIKTDWKEIAQFLPKIIRYDVNDYKDPTSMIIKTFREKFTHLLYELNDETGSRKLKSKELNKILECAEKEINEEAQNLKKYITKYNPDIEDIHISPEFDFSNSLLRTPIEIIDKKTSSTIPFENRGFGTQKRLFMGIFDWDSSVIKKLEGLPVIRCYDEPDTNLHIDAQRKMYKAIKKIISSDSNNQIIVCTHSLFMIDNMPIETIGLLKRSEDSTTTIEFLEEKEEFETNQFMTSVCKEMGLSNSHIFFEKAFILVEGKTEINFLPLAYKKTYGSSFTEDGISLINLDGNGAASNFMKLLMKNKRDLICLFLDADTENLRIKELHKAYNPTTADCNIDEYKKWVDDFFSEKIIYIGNKELEDSFSDTFIVKVLNKHRPKEGLLNWTTEEISQLKEEKKCSDAIIKAVAENCDSNYISKPELGKYFAEECTIDDIPEDVKRLFISVRKIIDYEEEEEEEEERD